jgi:hypothetical protein
MLYYFWLGKDAEEYEDLDIRTRAWFDSLRNRGCE